jgi:L-threonylcarbamoyladenylate synthase
METRILPTDLPPLLHQAVDEAVRLLRGGEVVALPTETVYGLAADALNAAAVAKIFEVKERPTFDPLIVHLPHKKDIAMVADVPPEIAAVVQKLTDRFWPGPLTLLLPKKPEVPDLVTAGMPTVAVRVSSNNVFKRVAQGLGRPLAAPSANRFGSISPTSAPAVQAELDGRIELILDGGASLHGLESTIIKVEAGDKKPLITIVRPGPITPDDLKPFGRVQRIERTLIDEASEAPGQLASHYAPRTPLRLLEKPSDFTPEPGKKYALLSYRGDPDDGYADLTEWEQILILSPGKGKLPEAGVRFFYVLRELDNAGVDEIIAEPLHEHGVGIAMMDKLRRASMKVAQASPAANSQGNPAANAKGVGLHFKYFDARGETLNDERNVPHWRQSGVPYFVTFCLADALPPERLAQWTRDREDFFATYPQPWSRTVRSLYQQQFTDPVHEWLDAGAGECVLRDPAIAGIVADALRHFDGDRYELSAWAVMPNHVHILMTPNGGHTLEKILDAWKSYTAHALNKALGRDGDFWQARGYDAIVRGPESARAIAEYILNNPAKAGFETSYVESRI